MKVRHGVLGIAALATFLLSGPLAHAAIPMSCPAFTKRVKVAKTAAQIKTLLEAAQVARYVETVLGIKPDDKCNRVALVLARADALALPPLALPANPTALASFNALALPPLALPADPATQAVAWATASRADSYSAYRDYLAAFPNGENASSARQRAEALAPPLLDITKIVWKTRSEPGDFSLAYPSRAFAQDLGGRSIVECILDENGKVKKCWIIEEDPQGLGFGEAQMRLMSRWEAMTQTLDGQPVAGGVFRLAITWRKDNDAPLPPDAPAIDAAFLDARTTPSSIRAPLVSDPARLPDFALFKECENCPEMVVIPGDSFLMGSPQNEAGRFDSEDDTSGPGGNQVNVRVPRFAISRFETTWEEWAACVSAKICQQDAVDEAGGDQGWGRGRRPVINVDWEDAGVFARWVSGQIGAATPNPYRRPTEAEWEYAARGGTGTAYPWGPAASHEHANYGTDVCCHGLASGRDQWVNTSPVGSFPANPFGLFDMHGNVYEWVEDCARGNLSGQTAGAYTTSGCAYRVDRSGSWYGIPQSLRSASRGRVTPSGRDSSLGFRLARTL